jgi:hypothetical protein
MEINSKDVDVSSLIIEGMDYRDAPDFCDAYIQSGLYIDGTPITEDDLDNINVHDLLLNRL